MSITEKSRECTAPERQWQEEEKTNNERKK